LPRSIANVADLELTARCRRISWRDVESLRYALRPTGCAQHRRRVGLIRHDVSPLSGNPAQLRPS